MITQTAARQALTHVRPGSALKQGVQHAAEKALPKVHDLLQRSPELNEALSHLTGPMIKRKFNAPSKAVAGSVPAPLQAKTIEEARALMASRFKPNEGKVLIGISGGGKETVHAFVVSGVKPDGSVRITQALAQVSDQPEAYQGFGGKVSQLMDKLLGNKPNRMQGVVEEDWAQYAVRAKRNSIAVLELEADPKLVKETLDEMKGLVGKPYDGTMLAADPATAATLQELYCTEVSAWFVNKLKPGTIKQSDMMGFPLYQVADHMKATTVHGGPLKVLFNGENRLDIKAADPFPKQAL